MNCVRGNGAARLAEPVRLEDGKIKIDAVVVGAPVIARGIAGILAPVRVLARARHKGALVAAQFLGKMLVGRPELVWHLPTELVRGTIYAP